MTIRRLSMREAEYIAHALALELMNSKDEPIPPFSTADRRKLESCLQEPFQTFDGKFLHWSFSERAAVLFYLITKNHCFENGNKRMAVTLTALFFYVNKRWISISPDGLYKIACEVAESEPRKMDMYVKILSDLFKKYEVSPPAGQ